MKNIFYFVLVLVIMFPLAKLLSNALKKQDISDCSKWSVESKSFEDYYLTKWQVDQCLHYGITFDGVPVK